MKILLITPPMTQVAAPYPATTVLTGFLKSRGHEAVQEDASIQLATRILSPEGLAQICQAIEKMPKPLGPDDFRMFRQETHRYTSVVTTVMEFLRGRERAQAFRIANRTLLPESRLFQHFVEIYEASKSGRHQDVYERAMSYAGFFVLEIMQIIRHTIEPQFDFTRYEEALAISPPSFDPLEQRLGRTTLIDTFLEDITAGFLDRHEPGLVGITVPFPGNMYGALRIGEVVKRLRPRAKIVIGGGYCNSELRSLSDSRIFRYLDYITLDDGERPLECLLEHLEGKRGKEDLLRTLTLHDGKVRLFTTKTEKDVPHGENGTPTYVGLPLTQYFADTMAGYGRNLVRGMMDNHFWNKLTLAHGCYWRKCTFCDIHLDYIERYDKASADVLADRMESLAAETGASSFHFTDEACPPVVLAGLSQRLIARGRQYVWYGNIRFDRAFSRRLTDQLAASGCVAVTGGLEVASDRILKLMDKGTTVSQVAQVAKAFTASGIAVHAYLIYGFPSQTAQEVVDSLELVRQFFALGHLRSAAWHRFTVGAHSPIGRTPERFDVILDENHMRRLAAGNVFAVNIIPHRDRVFVDYDALGPGLMRATSAYMNGDALDEPVESWFPRGTPGTTIAPDHVQTLSSEPRPPVNRDQHRETGLET